MTKISPALQKKLLQFQQNELTEAEVYDRLALISKDPHNQKILRQIAADERAHAKFWRQHAGGEEMAPRMGRVHRWIRITKIFGLTFGVRYMERGEQEAQVAYAEVVRDIPEARAVIADEERHEQELLGCLNEKKLEYVGSVVLGLNDALVELTGALAGFAFAIQNTEKIAILGLITGIAASLSMASSEYLSTRAENGENALTSALYTGVAYICTTILLIVPFAFFENYLHALGTTLAVVVAIIAGFNFYIAVAKNESFKKRFWEMTLISLGVAALSFGIGVAVRLGLGIEI